MVRAKKLAQREQVKLEFTHPQPAVKNVIHLARLDEFFSAESPRELAMK
jgi:anti-anti-sigma regulatory factor